MSTMAYPESVPPEIVARMHRCASCEPDRRPRMFVCAYHEGQWDMMEEQAAVNARALSLLMRALKAHDSIAAALRGGSTRTPGKAIDDMRAVKAAASEIGCY